MPTWNVFHVMLSPEWEGAKLELTSVKPNRGKKEHEHGLTFSYHHIKGSANVYLKRSTANYNLHYLRFLKSYSGQDSDQIYISDQHLNHINNFCFLAVVQNTLALFSAILFHTNNGFKPVFVLSVSVWNIRIFKNFYSTAALQLCFFKGLEDTATVLLNLVCPFLLIQIIIDRHDDGETRSPYGTLDYYK